MNIPILTSEHPLSNVERIAAYFIRSSVIRARAAIDPDYDERTRKVEGEKE